jgi:hypothetical protein
MCESIIPCARKVGHREECYSHLCGIATEAPAGPLKSLFPRALISSPAVVAEVRSRNYKCDLKGVVNHMPLQRILGANPFTVFYTRISIVHHSFEERNV